MLATALAGQFTRALWENPDNAFLPRWLPMFIVGIACAEFAARCERDGNLARRAGPALVGLGAGFAVFLSTHPASLLIWLVVFSVSVGAWEQFLPPVGRLVGGLMRLRQAQWLGAISYPLYLLHWPFIGAMLALLQRLKPDLKQSDTFVVMLLTGMPMLLGLSWLVHRLVEKPMMRLGRRLTHRPAVGAVVPAGS